MSEPFDRALRAAARRSRPAGVCPDAASLAAYADNGLTADERRLVEAHAADCATCLEHLALLGAISLDREAPEPSRSWLVRWGWLVPVATAVLVVAVWVRLPDQKASEDASAAFGAKQTAPIAMPEHERPTAAAAPSEERDAAGDQARRLAAKTAQAPPARQVPPAETKVDELASLERRDSLRKRVATAPAPVAAPPPAAPEAQAQEANAKKPEPLLDDVSEKQASPAPLAAAAPRATDSAAKEAVGASEARPFGVAGQRREADQLMSKTSAAPLVVSASPKAIYRAIGSRIELSEDGGSTWRVAVSVTHVTFTAAACAPGGPCWFGTSVGTLVRLAPHGQSSPLPSRSAVQSIVPETALRAVVTVEGGQRFRTTDGGITWKPL